MYRSGKRLRLLVNDPNYVRSERPTLRSIDDVLLLIDCKDKINNSSNSSIATSSISSNQMGSAQDINSRVSYKRQKKSYEYEESVASNGGHSKDNDIRVFKVIYGAFKPNKKHKQFSSDGFLTVGITDRLLRLYSMEGKGISESKLKKNLSELQSGNRLLIGSKELEIDEELSPIDFKNKKYFIQSDD